MILAKKEFFREMKMKEPRTEKDRYIESCRKQEELIKEFGEDAGKKKHSEWLKASLT